MASGQRVGPTGGLPAVFVWVARRGARQWNPRGCYPGICRMIFIVSTLTVHTRRSGSMTGSL